MASKLTPGIKDLLNYVKDLRAELTIIAILFIIFSILGFSVGINHQETKNQASISINENVTSTGSSNTHDSSIGLLINKFINCLLTTVLGLALGIYSILFIILIGINTGMTIAATLLKGNIPYFLTSIASYMVLDVPAMFLSSAIGLRLGYSLVKAFMGRKGLLVEVKNGIKLFVFGVIPLLILSAIIQALIIFPLLLSISN